jgi:hypothetical protein
MTRRYLAWVASAALLPFAGAGSALAQAPVQAIGQENASSQTANSDASSTQVGAQNRNISVRVLSPGDDGDVTQSNSSSADADASNTNDTHQSAAQQALGAAQQLIGQSNGSTQSANADATSKQIKPSNDNIVVRILSPGNGGDVTQSNSSSAGSKATNGNSTSQAATQQASGSGCGCGGHPAPTTLAPSVAPAPDPPAHDGGSDVVQAIGQENHNDQSAGSTASSEQYKPANQNISVRVLSPGHDGDVTQSNSSSADAQSSNGNSTSQSASQQAGGPVLVAAPATSPKGDPGHCGCGGDVLQLIGQENANAQRADAEASSKQAGASNSNVPVAIGGIGGGGGDVTQSNSSSASSDAGNHNTTGQSASQQAGGGRDCGCHKGGLVIQAIGQENGNRQTAGSEARSKQKDPSNENGSFDVGGYLAHGAPGPVERMVRKLGDVTQSNSSGASSKSANTNSTGQSAEQSA